MMVVFNAIDEVDFHGSLTVVLGNFDGVHKGHQKLIKEALKLGDKILIVTFEPHPMVYKGVKIEKIQSMKEKIAYLDYLGVDGVLIIPFDIEFASMEKETFVKDILVDKLKASAVVVGYNYHFGAGGLGSSSDIMALGKKYGFKGIVIPAYKMNNHIVSSTLIRNLLASGHISEVNNLLGYRYQVEGRVINGQGVGKHIGIPTANLEIDNDKLLPKPGVYSIIGKVKGKEYKGFCNVGFQPTFKDRERKLVVEANLFEFDEDIYGENLTLSFIGYIRPVKRFSSIDALLEQLSIDKKKALEIIDAQNENIY